MESDQYDTNPLFFIFLVGILGSAMVCVFMSVKRNRREEVVARKIRVDRGGIGGLGTFAKTTRNVKSNKDRIIKKIEKTNLKHNDHTRYIGRGLCNMHTSSKGEAEINDDYDSTSEMCLDQNRQNKHTEKLDHIYVYEDTNEKTWYNTIMASASGLHRYRNIADPTKATTDYRKVFYIIYIIISVFTLA